MDIGSKICEVEEVSKMRKIKTFWGVIVVALLVVPTMLIAPL
ncbi:MAG: hypothetical protein WBC40_07155 [Halobacteriota archaeon]